MVCSVACIWMLLGTTALAAEPVQPLLGRDGDDSIPSTSPMYSSFQPASDQAQPKGNSRSTALHDSPTAPLPPALWPALGMLAVLATARFAIGAAKKPSRR